MAVKKYFTEKGLRALPTDSTPHSKASSLFFVFRLGPKKCVPTMVETTKPEANKNWRKIGK